MATLIAAGIELTAVDPRHLVVRELDEGSNLGGLVAMGFTGRVTFTPTDSRRVVWVMNALNGADYAGANKLLGGHFVFQVDRYGTMTRLTRQNNPHSHLDVIELNPADIQAGLARVNDAWRVSGVRLSRTSVDW